MRKVFFISLMLLGVKNIHAQTLSCCSSPVDQFASFSNDADFVNTHEDPVPFTYYGSTGEMITFLASDGKEAQAYAIKPGQKSNKYLIVFHEWWGLNDYIKQISDKLFTDLGDVNVIALDLYEGKVAPTKKEAQTYMQEMDTKRVEAIIEGIKTKIGADAEIATIGWCMGGGWSLQGSLIMQKEGIGCVMYYGYPEENIEKIKWLNAPVLFILATQDKWVTPDVVNTFEKNMHDADKKIKVLSYDADHAFANPSNPKYNKEAADDAYIHTIEFLKEVFE